MLVGAARAGIMNSGHAGFRNHVRTPAFRRTAGARRLRTKNAKTTPCTVDAPCRNNDLRQGHDPSEEAKSILTRRAKQGHTGIIAIRVSIGLHGHVGLTSVAHKPCIDI